ncbi:arylsulfotransferase family protein [Ruegeria arenilitoris]|uniref:arylsulfotransferase family protein n=1 Tax=Ruegeria arenilitoris TaxID=1173585 RepID=UPI001480E134|nr:arylsulfotransferase family protein [Ruegeria arenilitoris]
MKLVRFLGEHFSAVLFGFSILSGAYVYGVVSYKYEWFPVPVLQQAKAGFDAWRKLEAKEVIYGKVEDVAVPKEDLTTWLVEPRDYDDLLLITGGFEEQPELCPELGCIAWIMDREGNVFHTWSVSRADLFDGQEFEGFSGQPRRDNVNVLGVDLEDNGDLVVTFQAKNMFPYHIGSMRIDRNSKILWSFINHAHHWPHIAGNGDALLPWAQLEQPPEQYIGPTRIETNCSILGAVYEEGFQIFDRAGERIRAVRFEDLFVENGLMGLAYSVREGCDPYHINGIVEINEATAAKIEGAEAGDIAMSLRSSSSLIVVDRYDDVVHRVIMGPMVAQHSPVVTERGTFVLFDNLGGLASQGGSRILEIDPVSGLGTSLFPLAGDTEHVLFSEEQGVVRLSENNERALVSVSETGQVLEVDLLEGRPIWEFLNQTSLSAFHHRIGESADANFALMETRGADYVARDFVEGVLGRTAPIGAVQPGAKVSSEQSLQ